jgi:hypothetical protein
LFKIQYILSGCNSVRNEISVHSCHYIFHFTQTLRSYSFYILTKLARWWLVKSWNMVLEVIYELLINKEFFFDGLIVPCQYSQHNEMANIKVMTYCCFTFILVFHLTTALSLRSSLLLHTLCVLDVYYA